MEVSFWTSSQLNYDQRVQRIVDVFRKEGAQVRVFDRQTNQYPEGQIALPYNRGPAMYFKLNQKIARLIRQTHSDLIYAADIDVMPGIMWGLGRRKKTPVILDLHEYFPEVVELQGKPLKQKIWRMIEQRSVRFASSVLTVNESLARIYGEKYQKEISVIRNMPLLDPVEEALSPDQRLENKILYYQGAINAGRGLEELILSLRYLPGWTLWLVGEGDICRYLQDLVVRQTMENRVVFWGRKLPADLPALASQATVGFNLLDSTAPSYYYSLANKYFDYIHALLPALHMDFPEYRTLLRECHVGRLVTDLNPPNIAQSVLEMTGDAARYKLLVEHCKVGRQRYNWQMESQKLWSVVSRF